MTTSDSDKLSTQWRTIISSKYYNTNRVNYINTTTLQWDRQYLNFDTNVRRRLHASPVYIDRLEQEAVLNGHEGCVNCLEWSNNGCLLASGSDDLQVIIWDPFRKKRVHSINTRHLGNMFSVKFLPQHNDALIATAAADKYIYVYDINHNNETVFTCCCHSMRVKRLATAPDSPHIFWSAGEDGNIMQLDIREPHRCNSEENRVRLISLATYLDSTTEAKCLAVNPRRTEYLAVGSNDPYARLFDRRMLRPVSSFLGNDNANAHHRYSMTRSQIPKDCVTYYCPGHIIKNNTKEIQHEARAITYLTFNAIGTELLVNIGCEHVYLYDIEKAQQPVFLNLPDFVPMSENEAEASEIAAVGGFNESSKKVGTGTASTVSSPPKRRKLPEHIEIQKKYANDNLENEKYLRAIEQYSDAIAMWPDCAVLYLNRATAYMRRQWFGDFYAALRDCHEALRLDPTYIKAHFRLARALFELGRLQDADECLKELINRFPSYATNHGVLMLHKDIKENRRSSSSLGATMSIATSSTTTTTVTTANNYVNNSSSGSSNEANNTTGSPDDYICLKISDAEYAWRSTSKDYAKRFVGHCNTTTDIKEANYFGYEGNFIIAGSDDGRFFIWERKTGKIRAIYHGDIAIVNCVQPHPDICMLATSGIDHEVKIWAPIAPSPDERPHLVAYIDKCVQLNQEKMRTDPFDINTRNAYCWSG